MRFILGAGLWKFHIWYSQWPAPGAGHFYINSQSPAPSAGGGCRVPGAGLREHPKIYISRTFGRWNLIDLSFQSEISCFNDFFIFISFFSDKRKCSNMLKYGQKGSKGVKRDKKRSKRAKRGPMEPKSISHEPLVIDTWYRPLISIRTIMFLSVFHIFHTS